MPWKESHVAMISPDAPIERIEDDRLGRAPFAAAIAKAIRSSAGSESFVVGINGKWGSGKSSVVNLCATELKKQATDPGQQIDVLRFNPWNFADQNQLVLQFFRQFTGHLRKLGTRGAATINILVENLDAYATALAPPIEALPYVKWVWPWLRSGVGLARKKWGLGQDLESMFDTISTQLETLKRKTVVIIDDLDRLNASEIRQVFQLVKVSARFPHVVYILAFDKSVVALALADLKVGSGEEYLEKIVQVPFDLPPISESILTKMISDSLDDLLSRYPTAHFDNHRFQNLFFSGCRQSFESLRDVRRFLNSLEFGFGMIGREANGVDFIGLEALRIFHPAVYEVVRRNKKLFAGYVDVFTERRGHEAFQAELNRTLEGTGDVERVKDLLVELFPKLAYAYSNRVYGTESETDWEKDLRVASSRYFDLYFQLTLPNDEVSVAEIDQAVEAARDTSAFGDALVSFLQSKRIVNAISSIRYRLSDVKPELLPNLLAPLIDIGDAVKQRGSPLFGDIPEFWQVRWAIFDVLDRLPAANHRY
jgi:predicted KAP-like P-loop ATPase